MLDGGQSERSASSSAASAGLDCSSDDEVQSLVGFSGSAAVDSPLPLEFRSSPPEGAHRPTRSLSPPPKFFLADQDMAAAPSSAMLAAPAPTLSVANGNGSPRKRHRHHAHRHHHHMQQRPCLDFEKMQQVRFIFLFPISISLEQRSRCQNFPINSKRHRDPRIVAKGRIKDV